MRRGIFGGIACLVLIGAYFAYVRIHRSWREAALRSECDQSIRQAYALALKDYASAQAQHSQNGKADPIHDGRSSASASRSRGFLEDSVRMEQTFVEALAERCDAKWPAINAARANALALC